MRIPVLRTAGSLLVLVSLSTIENHAASGVGAPEINPAQLVADFYVNPVTGNDSNPGTAAQPFRTLGRGLLAAQGVNASNIGVTVHLAPGEYFEGSPATNTAIVFPAPTTPAPIVVQGQGWSPGVNTGDVILTGSEVWTSWTYIGGGVWSKPWPYVMPVVPGAAFGDPLEVIVPLVVRRMSGLFVNGEPYYFFNSASDPNLSRLAASEGAFWIDYGPDTVPGGGDDTIRVKPPASITDLNTQTVRVTTRGNLLHFWRPSSQATQPTNIVMRNIVVEHSGSTGLIFQNHGGLILEDMVFRGNKHRGSTVESAHMPATIRRSVYTQNGEQTITTRGTNMLYEDLLLHNNARQSFLVQYFGWSTGAFKIGESRNCTFRRIRSLNNWGLGAWFDTGNVGCELVDSVISGNSNTSLFIENNNSWNIPGLGTQTTVTVRNTVFTNNNRPPSETWTTPGIQIGESENVVIRDSLIAGNDTQLRINGLLERGPHQNIQHFNNIIASTVASQPLFANQWGIAGWRTWFDTLNATTNYNAYYHPNINAFRDRHFSSALISFSNWQSGHLSNVFNFSSNKAVDGGSIFSNSVYTVRPFVSIQALRDKINETQPAIAAFRVFRLDANISSPLTVGYTIRTNPGDAINSVDFATLSGSLTIQANALYADIFVDPISGDGLEPPEPLVITLNSNPAIYELGQSSAEIIIEDESVSVAGPSGAFHFSASTAQINEDGRSVHLVVHRSHGDTGVATVDYSIATGGSATPGLDFTSVSGTLYWANGDSSPRLITVPITNDTLSEGDENFIVQLTNPTGGAVLLPPATIDVIIKDDDQALPTAPVLSAVATSPHNIQLNWTSIPPATGYRLERSLDGTNWITVSSNIPVNTLTWIDNNLNYGTTYYYRIRAFNQAGHSPWNQTHAVTHGGETLTLTFPYSVVFENAGTITATVTRTGSTALPGLVYLYSSSPRVGVPTTVTIPAGDTTTTFTITLYDDNIVQGSDETITIRAKIFGPFASESFEYTPASLLHDQNGGIGWTTEWKDTDTPKDFVINSGSLNYPGWGSSGGYSEGSLNANGSNAWRDILAFRQSGVVYAGLLMQLKPATFPSDIYFGLDDGDHFSATSWMDLRFRILTNGNVEFMRSTYNSNQWTATSLSAGPNNQGVNLLIVKVDFGPNNHPGGGDDQLKIWINPVIDHTGAEPPGAFVLNHTMIPIYRISTAGWWRDARFDEIRLSETFAGLTGVPSNGQNSFILRDDDNLTGYPAWQATHFPSPDHTGPGAPHADPDGDSVPNLFEYFLDGDPHTTSNHNLLPLVGTSTSGPNTYLTLSFTPQNLSGLTVEIIGSTNMTAWSTLANLTPQLTSNVSHTFTDTLDINTNPTRFIALRLTTTTTPVATATTIPVGWVVMDIAAGTGSAKVTSNISPALFNQSNNSGAQTGRILSVTANKITAVGTPGWTAGALATPSAPYIVRITSGAAAGHSFLIEDNDSNSLTIHNVYTSFTSLLSLGIVTGPQGDTFRIDPCDTLLGLVGDPVTTGVLGGGSSNVADTVIVQSPVVGNHTYYFNTAVGHWVRVGASVTTNFNFTPLPPDTGLQYQRLQASPIKTGVIGIVPHTQRRAWVRNSGQTSLAQGWPVPLTLNSSSIHSIPAWLFGPNPSTSDIVTVGTQNHFWDGSVWRRQSFGFPISNPVLPVSSAQSLNKKGSATGCTILLQNLPYTLP